MYQQIIFFLLIFLLIFYIITFILWIIVLYHHFILMYISLEQVLLMLAFILMIMIHRLLSRIFISLLGCLSCGNEIKVFIIQVADQYLELLLNFDVKMLWFGYTSSINIDSNVLASFIIYLISSQNLSTMDILPYFCLIFLTFLIFVDIFKM